MSSLLVGPGRLLAAVTCLGAVGLLAGCGLTTSNGFVPPAKLAGPLASVKPLDGADIAVGSKNFTEQLVLGKIAGILLNAAGANVTDLTNIPGSSSAREAQLAGQVDMEWEYTGTAWISYLGHTNPIPNAYKQYVAVRNEEIRKNNLAWLPPAPMNDTYGFAVRAAKGRQLNVTSLSDLTHLPQSELSFCVESEFASRDDGFHPMLDAYDVTPGHVDLLDTGAIYAATARGTCNFGEVFTTDGRIRALNLTVLKDDKNFFPIYSLCPVIRAEVLHRYPQLRDLFDPVSKRLTNQTLITLNAKVDVQGQEPVDVAYHWLRQEGFIR